MSRSLMCVVAAVLFTGCASQQKDALEDVAKNSKPPEVENVDKLREEIKKADDAFSDVMDLRRQLEEAYRNSRP